MKSNVELPKLRDPWQRGSDHVQAHGLVIAAKGSVLPLDAASCYEKFRPPFLLCFIELSSSPRRRKFNLFNKKLRHNKAWVTLLF